MILFTNGDSWTQGDSPAQTPNWEATKTEEWYDIVPNFGKLHNLDVLNFKETRILYKFYDSQVWPKVLGKKLGLETWNAGRLGDSCDGIVKRTIHSIEWLKNQGKKDIFAIIGWTSAFRLPFYFVHPIKREICEFQLRPFGFTDECLEGIDMANLIQNFFHDEKEVLANYILNILTLQNYFKQNNIDYLMFNAFYKYEGLQEYLLYDSIDKTKWVNCNIHHAHFKDFILQKHNLKTWDDERYFGKAHPKDISHIEWADYLYKYIQTL